VWHRHWWVLLRRLFWSTVLNLGLLVVFVLWPVAGAIVPIDPGLEAGGLLLILLLWGLSFLWIWYEYEDWKNDYWIVTDTHIIDVDALPLISEDRRQARLEDIQDVRAEVPGFFDRLISKGNVFAETAGKAQNFELREVMNPQSIQNEIFNRRARARALAQQSQSAAKEADYAEIAEQAAQLVMERIGWVPPADQ
ncbi:MAG: hypothetical protein KKA73_00450, partial [Chloroflexi bacterium]|nr:hypothetical protein [Chloroflexota bacterium]